MDRTTGVIKFSIAKRLMILRGWKYDWTRWRYYKQDKAKRDAKELARQERAAHNDKVCRMYGLGKYSYRGYWE